MRLSLMWCDSNARAVRSPVMPILAIGMCVYLAELLHGGGAADEYGVGVQARAVFYSKLGCGVWLWADGAGPARTCRLLKEPAGPQVLPKDDMFDKALRATMIHPASYLDSNC